jgi:hypothetical protein
MSDAPEKIWRWDVYAWDHIIEYSEFPVISENSVEYTRSDIAQARVAKLEAALKYISDHAGQTGFKQTATHENATLICEFALAALGETT